MAEVEVELEQIGPYTITKLLKADSTSSLYAGKQQRKKDCVIRLFHTPLSTLTAKEAFLARAKQLKKLKHRHIIDIQDGGLTQYAEKPAEYGYLVMSSISGETLRQRYPAGERLTSDETKRIFSSVAAALQYAHISNIVHGNLHPGNLLIGSNNDILVSDFSFALALPDNPDGSFTSDVSVSPAVAYMAPEQLRNMPTTASDQYALAAMIYEWLCGQRPYQTTERVALLHSQEHDPLPPPRSLNDKISHALEQVLIHALAFDQNERFPHMQAFADNYLHALMGLPIDVEARKIVPIVTHPANKASSNGSVHKGKVIIEAVETIIDTPTLAASLIPKTETTNNGEIELDAIPFSPPEQQKTAPEKEPITHDYSHLVEMVTSDLRQGGLLSQSLPGYEERPEQIEMATLVARALQQGTPAIIEAGTGTGKALDVDTPIPTPTGWKRMGDLVNGDFVFDENGQPTRVIAAFDVMYDHTCYEVGFSDGSSIVADAEHEWVSYTSADRKWAKRSPRTETYMAKNFVTTDQLAKLDQFIALSQDNTTLSKVEAKALIGGHTWSIHQATTGIVPVNAEERPARYPHQTLLTAVRNRLVRDLSTQRRDGRPYTIVTTQRMAATLTVSSSLRTNHAIPVADPLVLPEAELPIVPYFLGVWLGDGSSYNNQITTADPDLNTEIEKDGYTVRALKSHSYLYAVDDENGKGANRWRPGMTGRLRKLGLVLNKHIPAIYLRASEQQRRALLAGLLDTDGTVNRCGAVEFTTTSPQLAQGTYELVCSLGFRPALHTGRARLNGKDCGPKWTIAFTTDQQVFRLKRKVAAHKERLRNYSPERNRFRYVIAVRQVLSRPVRCIQVDSPSHLYIAGRSMIPTHNSLAYLLPIIRSSKVAIVSTANKALQEQIFFKDIPFIQQHIKPFEAALVKGMANYVCLDRLENERVGMQFYVKNPDFSRLVEITNDPDAKFNGDIETLGFQLPGDIRSKVYADGDQCAWSKCNYFADCYVRKMRIKAERAQVIVVNHTLLLLDAALDGYLLPERDVIVLDEAHHLEEEATRAFTLTISPNSITTLLAQRMLKDHSTLHLQEEANTAAMKMWERLRMVADPGYKGRANLQEPLEEGLKLATIIGDLADSLRKQRPKDLPDKESQLYDKLLKRTQNLAENTRIIFSVAQPDKFVYYFEKVTTAGQRGNQLQVSAAPLDVTEWLKERLFDKCNVICTSATLATVSPESRAAGEKGGNFNYFRRRVGLDPIERPDVIERVLPLTFDYESNALLYVPRDLPEPVYGAGSDDYAKSIAREMYRLVKFSRGRAFLLFSSKRILDLAFDLMAPHLDYPLLRQGDMTRLELTRKFREEKGAILFGLKSFWEGVDIVGDTLSLVVIDKLPFDPPDDPVHEARVAHMKAAGENWFGIYVLPQAVLRLKQGLGRLLRTREDRGVMAILDTRLYSKGYGKMVLDALPPARRTSNIKDVAQFFAEE